ncbi:hypothetical protein GYD59_000319 [Salmonella enterica]|nr:hypothetical protein [Salmonella enterica]EEH2565680.1 hypothetical protein [Salmonella enterica]
MLLFILCVVMFPLMVMAVDLFIPQMIQLHIYCFFFSIADDDELANNALAATSFALAIFFDVVMVFVIAWIWHRLMRSHRSEEI